MKVDVLFFSSLRDEIGVDEIKGFEVKEGAKVSEVCAVLFEKYEKLKAWSDVLLVAVDQAYADREQVLLEGQEVALMPPVQGG